MKRLLAILAGASLGLVILMAGNPAEAKSCSECNALAGAAYRDCMATCDDSVPDGQKVVEQEKVEEEQIEEEQIEEATSSSRPKGQTAPCPFYGGARKPIGKCPNGCPDKKMSIEGNACKCPNNMKTSKNGMHCTCPTGMVENNLKCVDEDMDCGRCQYLVKELISQTWYCASKEQWFFSPDDYDQCPECPEGTISTGWKCMELPELATTKRSFMPWPPTLWDLLPWIIILILLAILIRGRIKDRERIKQALQEGMNNFHSAFETHVANPLRAELQEMVAKVKESRLGDLENVIIPFLELRLAEAKEEVEKARNTLENFGRIDGDKEEAARMSFAPTIVSDSDPRDKPTVDLDKVSTRLDTRMSDLQNAVGSAKKKVKKIEQELKSRKEEARSLGSKTTITYP